MSVGASFTSVIVTVHGMSNARPAAVVGRADADRGSCRVGLEVEDLRGLQLVRVGAGADLESVVLFVPDRGLEARACRCGCRRPGRLWSSVPTVVPAGWFSAIVVFESAMSVGAEFALVVNENG